MNLTINEQVKRILSADVTNELKKATLAQKSAFFIKTLEENKGNILRALDIYLYADREVREELNYKNQKRGLPALNYNAFARSAGDTEYLRAGGTLDAVSSPGGLAFIPTTVADIIERTTENLGALMNEVRTWEMNEGNLKVPVFDAFARASSVNTNTSLPSIGTTIENGLNFITLNTNRFGCFAPIDYSLFEKATAQNIQAIIELIAETFVRGLEEDIKSGNGSAPNILGMDQNATSVSAGTDDLQTLAKAIRTVSANRKGGLTDLRIFLNTAAFIKFAEIRAINQAYFSLINPGDMTIHGVKCIITDTAVLAGSAPSRTAVVTVGYPKLYNLGRQGRLDVFVDNFTGRVEGVQKVVVQQFVDGRPGLNNAFAKFTINLNV